VFERYTERARRSIFFARYEASVLGSSQIEIEHFLLGVLREDRSLSERVPIHEIRERIETHLPTGPKISTSVDLPLSLESKRAIGYSAEEAENLGHSLIDTRHQLLGILHVPSFATDLLREHGVDENVVRAQIEPGMPDPKADTLKPAVLALRELRFYEMQSARLSITELARLLDAGIAFEQWLTHDMKHLKFEVADPTSRAEWCKSLPRAPLFALWLSINQVCLHILCQIPEDQADRVAAAAMVYAGFCKARFAAN